MKWRAYIQFHNNKTREIEFEEINFEEAAIRAIKEAYELGGEVIVLGDANAVTAGCVAEEGRGGPAGQA